MNNFDDLCQYMANKLITDRSILKLILMQIGHLF